MQLLSTQCTCLVSSRLKLLFQLLLNIALVDIFTKSLCCLLSIMRKCPCEKLCTIVLYSSYSNAEELGCAQTWLKTFGLGLSPFWGSWDHTQFSRSISLVRNKLIIWGRQSRGRVECLQFGHIISLQMNGSSMELWRKRWEQGQIGPCMI